MSMQYVTSDKKFAFLVLLQLVLFLQFGCTLNAKIEELNSGDKTSNLIALKVQGNLTQVDINEGSVVVLIIAQSAALENATKIKFEVEEKGHSSAAAFNNSFPFIQALHAGETISTLTLNTKHDLNITGNKNFRILISSEDPNILGTQLDLNILDLEANTPTLSVNNVTIDEGQNAVITFTLNKSSDENVSFNYATSNGTALSGVNYTTKNGSITIPAGSTTSTLTVTTLTNLSEICSNDKTFTVQLSDLQGAIASSSESLITLKDPDRPTISIANTSSIEASDLNFTVSLSAVCPNYDITFDWLTAPVTATSNVDYTHASSSSATITNGSTSISLAVTTTSDSMPESSEALNVVLSNPTNSSILQGTAIGTIQDDDFGDFTISGITSASEAIADAYLSDSINPTVSWSTATGATSYDVQIFEDDGVTSKCGVINTLTTNIALSACDLVTAQYYKASVTAKSATGSKSANNNLFRFYVNTNPSLNTSGYGPYFVLSGNSITIQVQGGASPIIGVAQDFENHTLSFSNIGTPSIGSISSSNASSFTLATSVNTYGKSSVSLTISDAFGGKLATTVEVNIMKPHTWTGKLSTTWNTAGNWCGSISADSRSCSGSPSAPTGSDIVYFDDTCSSTYTCSPTTASNISIAGVRIKANGFSQGTGFTISLGSSGWTQTGGIFTGSNSTIQFTSSNISLTGSGTFNSTSGNLNFSDGGFSLNDKFFHNNGTLNLNSGNQNLTSLSDLYNLSLGIWTAASFTLQNNLVVRGNLTTSGAGSIQGLQINVYGNITSTKTTNAGTTKFHMLGTNNQTLTSSASGLLPRMIINKTGGTLTGGSSIIIIGGGIEVLNSSVVDFTNSSININGGGGEPIQLNNNTVKDLSIGIWSSGSLTIKDNISVSGNLTLSGNGNPIPGFAGVKISTAGNLYLNLGCPCWGGKINLEMVGNTNTTLSVSGTPGGTIAGGVFGGNLIINKNSGNSVQLLSHLSLNQTGQNLIVTSGGFDMFGYNVTTLGLSLNSTTLVKNAGVLTVSGGTVGTGSLYGGTISP